MTAEPDPCLKGDRKGPLLELISSRQRKFAACILHLLCMDESENKLECPYKC